MTKKQLEQRVKELEEKVTTQEKVRSIWGAGYAKGLADMRRKFPFRGKVVIVAFTDKEFEDVCAAYDLDETTALPGYNVFFDRLDLFDQKLSARTLAHLLQDCREWIIKGMPFIVLFSKRAEQYVNPNRAKYQILAVA